MSCGTPVIGPKAPDLETILQNSGGGFCASSVEEVGTLIEKFADSGELAKSMGRNARRYVELNHDLNRLTMLKVELMSKIVSSKRFQGQKDGLPQYHKQPRRNSSYSHDLAMLSQFT